MPWRASVFPRLCYFFCTQIDAKKQYTTTFNSKNLHLLKNACDSLALSLKRVSSVKYLTSTIFSQSTFPSFVFFFDEWFLSASAIIRKLYFWCFQLIQSNILQYISEPFHPLPQSSLTRNYSRI